MASRDERKLVLGHFGQSHHRQHFGMVMHKPAQHHVRRLMSASGWAYGVLKRAQLPGVLPLTLAAATGNFRSAV
jgi:hypothetical protein